MKQLAGKYLAPLALISAALFAQSPPLVDAKIAGISTADWPAIELSIYVENLETFSPEQIASWEIAVNWVGQSCSVTGPTTAATDVSDHVLLMVDNSSSMKDKFEYVEQGHKIFIDGLPRDTRLSINRFRNRTPDDLWDTQLLAQSSNSRYYLKKQHIFSSLTEKTYLYDAVYQGLVYFDILDEKGQKSIVIFSDGSDVGSSTALKQVKKRAVDSGIPMFFIDFSPQRERNRPARDLVEATSGFYAASTNPKEVTDIFYDILHKLKNRFVVNAAFPAGLAPIPPDGELVVEISQDGITQVLTRAVESSEAFKARQNQVIRLESASSLESPSEKKPDGLDIYSDDWWQTLGMTAIGKQQWALFDRSILELESSDNVFSQQRRHLLLIARAEAEQSPAVPELCRSYAERFHDGIHVDEVNWKLVQWHRARNETDHAISAAKTLLIRFPWSRYADDATMLLAGFDVEQQNPQMAETRYLEVGQFYPEGDRYGESLSNLAQLYIDQGEAARAEAFLLAVEDEFNSLSNGGELYNQLILSQVLQNKYQEATKTVDTFSRRMPESTELPRAMLTKASIYWNDLNQPEQAKRIFESLLAQGNLDPELMETIQKQYDQLQTELSLDNDLRNRMPTDSLLSSLTLGNGWEVGPDLPEKFLKKAAELIAAEQYQSALLITRAVSSQYRITGIGDRALIMTAQIYAKEDSTRAQIEALRSIPLLFPGSSLASVATHRLARLAVDSGNQLGGLELYQELLSAVHPEYAGLDSARVEYDALRDVARVFLSGAILGIAADRVGSVSISVYKLPARELAASFQPDAQASYKIALDLGNQYTLIAEAPEFLPLSLNLDYRELIAATELRLDLSLVKIETGSRITLNNVMFDLSSSDLRPESEPTLDEMVRFIGKYPGLEVEIAGHTDSIGDTEFNEQLSVNRALSVARYLLSKGVSMQNIRTKGYAAQDPVASNETSEGRAQNRRVEIRILKE